MYFVILLGLAIPLPLAIYLLILYALNSRAHPVMLSGAADFALLWFGSSGFVIFGGPCILAGFHERARDYLLFGPLKRMTAYDWRLWIGVWLGYTVVVIAVSLLLLWRRRRVTCIYNIERTAFREALAESLERLKLDWLRDADLVFITVPDARSAAPAANERAAGALAPGEAREAVVRVDAFPAMRHVALLWRAGDERLRHEVENELEQTLERLPTRPNPAATWMFSIAGSLFALMFFTAATLVMFLYFLGQAQPS